MTTTRTAVWQALQWTGLEYFTLTPINEGFVAEGQLIGVYEADPYNLQYQLRIDTLWRVRDVLIHTNQATEAEIHLMADGRGQWYNQDGIVLPELTDCLDVDLTLTPFTNTLPIRRLPFQPEQSQPIRVVYIDLPEGKISPVEQVYTARSDHSYRFHQPALAFMADLSVDANGLITDYPNLFRRIH